MSKLKSNYNKRKGIPESISKLELSKIKSIYKMCRRLSKKTGLRHEVEHIIPINGEDCSGLHIPSNLKIVAKLTD